LLADCLGHDASLIYLSVPHELRELFHDLALTFVHPARQQHAAPEEFFWEVEQRMELVVHPFGAVNVPKDFQGVFYGR
jgi:hypothetical protein